MYIFRPVPSSGFEKTLDLKPSPRAYKACPHFPFLRQLLIMFAHIWIEFVAHLCVIFFGIFQSCGETRQKCGGNDHYMKHWVGA